MPKTALIILAMQMYLNAAPDANALMLNQLGNADQKEWSEWCLKNKNEMSDLLVFNTIIEDEAPGWQQQSVDFLKFDSLAIPYVRKEGSKISISHPASDEAVLRVEYDSGLQISVRSIEVEAVKNIFDRFGIDPPEAVRELINERYESSNKFTTNLLLDTPSYIELRIAGFSVTPDNIDCDSNDISNTLSIMARVLAGAGSDHAAMKEGRDIAYRSGNSMKGVITRQGGSVFLSQNPARVNWMGEFIRDNREYHVIISFFEDDNDEYNVLGKALANPNIEKLGNSKLD